MSLDEERRQALRDHLAKLHPFVRVQLDELLALAPWTVDVLGNWHAEAERITRAKGAGLHARDYVSGFRREVCRAWDSSLGRTTTYGDPVLRYLCTEKEEEKFTVRGRRVSAHTERALTFLRGELP